LGPLGDLVSIAPLGQRALPEAIHVGDSIPRTVSDQFASQDKLTNRQHSVYYFLFPEVRLVRLADDIILVIKAFNPYVRDEFVLQMWQ
jgi:hypothetical protein